MKLARFNRPDLWSGWSAFDQLTSLRDEINRLFEVPEYNGNASLNAWAPSVDLYEDSESLLLRAELPGLSKKEIDISLHENVVTISGERKNERKSEAGKLSREERFVGRFTRSISLPKPVDPEKVKAEYRDGVLVVTLPKAEEAKPRQIAIEA